MALTDNISINSILGVGSSIKGDVKINGFARIDGDIDGNLEAAGNIIIGEHARIRGNVTGRSVTIIGGIILGNIVAPEFVRLLSTSAVIGDIQTKRLYSEENAIIHGHCISRVEAADYEKATSDWGNVKAISSMSVRI
ncbi:polymer-forming cytoskeletal protein [Treponema sp.]|uniref:bactofilin family protein n=1 Tax=Treponema sp. TaxID=166 RepID=UPI002A839DE7|nr:polymer-forming cytoskeletal protein [Treponema sp.]MCI6441755.1 polymer-forming cytoskeletal protein [Spirochaetia bacterium]MDY4133223.1 polymer-forming cytoskeletal protein [Treponema sp.]